MSTLKADTIQNTSGGAVTLTKQHAAKAYIYSPATSDSIHDSFNVSSIDDDALGRQGVNITSALSDANYVTTCGIETVTFLNTGALIRISGVFDKSSSEINLRSDYAEANSQYGGGYEGVVKYNMTVDGDLA
jgi:hypothetical protein